ncbi:hypothetical protein QA601_13870 [Chitinispirillales bacterium ANBcel5]|uniref:hypothetical protein n=1 Tax=Cellulosispirillum alkaliphilum TaxID=3039283 RepID=UPI002A509B09|nr:hypothetical protein [Chitinispirillales bacterium ANBcel5]
MTVQELEAASAITEEEISDMPEIIGTIEEKVAAISGPVPDPHMPVTVFVGEFGKDLANMEHDRDTWEACGFDWNKYDIYKELHKELFRSNSKVVVNRENVSAAVQEWQKEQDNIKTERNRLIAACRVAAKQVPSIRSVLKEISEGNSNMDSIQDILSLAKLCLKVIDIVSNIVIGGRRIDRIYLNEKIEWASELKQLLNRADALRNVRQEEIIYRNKIILLCRQSQANINSWLDAVYFDNPDRKSEYASDYFRRLRNRSNRSDSQAADEAANPEC